MSYGKISKRLMHEDVELMKTNNKTKYRIDLSPFLFILNGGLLLLLFYFLTRSFFYVLNSDYFLHQDASSIAYAFLHGVRFDASSIALMNTPIVLALFVLVLFNKFNLFTARLTATYFVTVNTLALAINLIDAVYFPYTGRRSGPEIMSMMRDVSTQIPQLLQQYWWLIILGLGVLVVFVFGLLKIKRKIKPIETGIPMYLAVCSLIFISFVFMGRGGLQAKPIRSLHAYSWPVSDLGPLVLNTSFTLMKEKTVEMKRMRFFEDHQAALSALDKPQWVPVENVAGSPKNVVIIILESFGLEYFGPPYGLKSYTPFLETLAEKGRFFPMGVANGRRSIEAIPSILAGVPSLMSEAFMRSPFQSNKVYGLGELVKPYGYHTAFFHGAKNGSMYFDDTTFRLGFDEYFGLDQYPEAEGFDGQWGIFDEPFLQYSAQQMNAFKTPFLSSIFTISSHPPYTLPEQYEETFTEGEIPMHKVVQYTDWALQKFFETAATMDWFDNTLFIITADHTSDNYDKRFATPLGRHQIPIILYHPKGDVPPQQMLEIAQQVDIPATVIDYLNLPESDKLMPFGRSLLRSSEDSDAIVKEDGAYWLLHNGESMKLTIDDDILYVRSPLPSSFMLKQNLKSSLSDEALKQRLNAYVQLYINGLIDNKHYPNLIQ